MTDSSVAGKSFGQTSRTDTWWLTPALVLTGLTFFAGYLTWAAFQGKNYHFGPYLSPLYSPELFGESPHAWFGSKPSWWFSWLPWSPAFLILWAPGAFRFTCYYYRGAYYKAFAADPANCSVGEPGRHYRGERSFPLILQNVHRYFLYLALVFIVFLSYDVWKAMWFEDPATGKASFGLGVGTLVLAVNVVLIGCYTLGCHSLRHLVGGGRNTLSDSPVRHTAYQCASCLNRRHATFAWMSLVWVAFADLYVRLCATGVWSDWRIF